MVVLPQAMTEEGEDLPWEALAARAAGFQHLALEEVEEEEHQQAFRLVEEEERISRRSPEQAWMATTLYQQQRAA